MDTIILCIYILLALGLIPVAYYYWLTLRRKIWVQWIYSTLFYLWIRRSIDKRYRRMTRAQRLDNWTHFEINDHWSKKYWFGKSISKYVLNKYLNDGSI